MEDQLIEVKVKTPNDRKIVKVNSNATVKELRSEISKIYEVSEERLCLIFAGKILKDEELLSDSKIVDGVTVHLVVKQPPNRQNEAPQNPTPTQPTSIPSSNPIGQAGNPYAGMFGQSDLLGSMLGNMGGGVGGGAGSNFEDMQRNLQQQLMTNPDMMRSMLENPLMQHLLQSPEVMQTMMQSNPQIRQLMERNPEVGHILNNPSLMRQTMEMMRNPAMMQELMRHHDRALLNVEAFPGGMNHLTRLYRDVQEPLMDATTASNPFASLANRNTTNTHSGTENNEPLPNPWSSGGGGSQSSTSATPAAIAAPGLTNPNTNIPASVPASATVPSAEGLQSLLGSINDPRMQSVMDMLRNNPQFTEMAIANSPVAANPQLQEQIRSSMPQVLQAFERPEIRNALTNPRVLQAIFQIQQGLQILQQEAPQLIGIIPGSGTPATLSSPAAAAGVNLTSAMEPTNNNQGGQAPAASTMASQAQMAQMISSMMSIMSANPAAASNLSQPASSEPPEQMYATQLETMAQMGFPNRQANLRALIETFGDVNAAVNRILQFDP